MKRNPRITIGRQGKSVDFSYISENDNNRRVQVYEDRVVFYLNGKLIKVIKRI